MRCGNFNFEIIGRENEIKVFVRNNGLMFTVTRELSFIWKKYYLHCTDISLASLKKRINNRYSWKLFALSFEGTNNFYSTINHNDKICLTVNIRINALINLIKINRWNNMILFFQIHKQNQLSLTNYWIFKLRQ